ncbi:MAG: DUF302 domain-containing protein [Tistlia sp.]|uniref:DUF302 domain-containing protein n=1 Tax=Tistlia sp. TaxID=3057121 RepID=UPI0034A2758C
MRLRFPGTPRSRRVRAGLLAIALLTAGLPAGGVAAEQAVQLESAYSFTETLDRLRSTLESKGLTIFATLDHRAGALAAGLEMPPTTVLVYGNPKGGTPLMLAAPNFALELPLRVLVRESEDGTTYVVFNPAESLEGRHGLPAGMAERLAGPEKLIAEAVGAAGD